MSKRIAAFAAVLAAACLAPAQTSAYIQDCSNIQRQVQDAHDAYMANNDYKASTALYSNLTALRSTETRCLAERREQLQQASGMFNKAYAAGGSGKYAEAIRLYDEYKNFLGDANEENYRIASKNQAIAHFELGNVLLEKDDNVGAIENFQSALRLNPDDVTSQWNIGAAYSRMGRRGESLSAYEKAYAMSTDAEKIRKLKEIIAALKSEIKDEELRKSSATKDPFGGYQYYLSATNVVAAWGDIKSARRAVVAVIDDGVNVNHPDLAGKIWTNAREIPGNSKDDDGNGFVDDYNGWNFASDNLVNLIPSGPHGTMVAGVIAAAANNNEGVAGISPNVAIMPLRVFSSDGKATAKSIIEAITYALNNGADVINLSLGGHQFAYTDAYDEVFARAESMGVPVVVAAGNGDVLSNEQEGVNTDVNKISPLCNKSGTPAIIGVGAFDQEGYRTRWSNYGSCVTLFAPGVDIWSTTVPAYAEGSQYMKASGTSFATPIISGIIALGINKYGKADIEFVKGALTSSMAKNAVGNTIIDAKAYLANLGRKIDQKLASEEAAKRSALLTPREAATAEKLTKMINERLAKTPGLSREVMVAKIRSVALSGKVSASNARILGVVADGVAANDLGNLLEGLFR